MATNSYLYVGEQPGFSQSLSELASSTQLLRVDVAGSGPSALATIASAYPSTTSAANDYVAGSTGLASMGGLSPVLGNLIVGGGGSPATWGALTIGANTQVLTSDGATAAWAAAPTASNWSTYPATQNVNMGNFNLGISATGEMVNTINMFALTAQPTMPTVGGTLGFGALDAGTTAVGIFAGLPALDAVNFHQVVTVANGITNYGAAGSLLVGNAVGMAPGDYTVLGAGSDGQILTLAAGTPTWAAPATSGTVTSVGLTSSGGLIQGGTASPITSSGAYTLTLPGSGGSSAIVAGDLLLGSTGAYAGLAIGANTYVLTSNGTTASWAPPTGTFPLATYFDSGSSTFVAAGSLGAGASANQTTLLITGEADALPLLTSGYNNILLGDPGYNLTSGGANVIVGFYTGASRALSTGSQNVFVGRDAGTAVNAGNDNTLLGHNAGSNFDGSGNTFIGEGVGRAQNTYTNCVLIGDNGTDTTNNSLTNAIAIGSNAQVAASNTAVIGSTSLTGLGIGTDPSFGVPYSITVGTAGSGGVYLPRSSSQTIAVNGGVYGVNGSDQPYFTNQSGTFVLTPAVSFTWHTVSGTTQTLVTNNGYVATNAGLTTFTCPATAVLGATFKVYASTAAGWTILPGTTTQTIRFGNQITTASTGSLSSSAIGDCVEFVCIDATTPGSEVFGVVPGAVGNLTVL